VSVVDIGQRARRALVSPYVHLGVILAGVRIAPLPRVVSPGCREEARQLRGESMVVRSYIPGPSLRGGLCGLHSL
jgi:hypothetical protein